MSAEQFERFVYPSYSAPLLDAYERRFEAVFIILHPFIRVPEQLAWSVRRKYPTDAEIVELGSRCTWAQVARQTGSASCASLNQALLTAGGSLEGDLADIQGTHALQKFLQSHSIWMPAQGRFEPLLQRELLEAFTSADSESLIYVPEFPDRSPVKRLVLADLQAGSVPFPECGSLVAPDQSFLFTVDWDSFFTLLYGDRDFVTRAAKELKLEGFFASPNTDHAWFNYSMGCATVTLSPEHWQTA